MYFSAGSITLNIMTPPGRATYFIGCTNSLWSPCRAGDVWLCCRANKTDYKRYISEPQLAGGGLQRKQHSATWKHTHTNRKAGTYRDMVMFKNTVVTSQHALILQPDYKQQLKWHHIKIWARLKFTFLRFSLSIAFYIFQWLYENESFHYLHAFKRFKGRSQVRQKVLKYLAARKKGDSKNSKYVEDVIE